MAKTTKEYESQATTVSIRFTSRASVKIGDNFFTVEACEERAIPELPTVNIEQERKLLWDCVNAECDDQISDIIKVYGTKK